MAVAAEEGWIGTQPPVDVEERAERFRKTIERDEDFLYVVEQDGAIVGHGVLTTTRARGVYSFGILLMEEARGHGAGRKLLERLIEQARSSGAHKLELEVWPDNALVGPDGAAAFQLVEQLEVALTRSAHRTEPVVRDVVELRARRHAAVGVALGRVIDEPARDADEALTGHSGAR
jgi:GNAT superfamily N-acetyltransferase